MSNREIGNREIGNELPRPGSGYNSAADGGYMFGPFPGAQLTMGLAVGVMMLVQFAVMVAAAYVGCRLALRR